MPGAFDGIRVLEFADFIAGPYCTKLITDLGAEAVKIETPGAGDSARKFGPFPGDDPHPERSGLYLFLNSGKRSITLDPSLPTGRELFTGLVSRADVLVESSPPGVMGRMGLGYENLKLVNPSLVHVSITPYGQEGPKAHWKPTTSTASTPRERATPYREAWATRCTPTGDPSPRGPTWGNMTPGSQPPVPRWRPSTPGSSWVSGSTWTSPSRRPPCPCMP